MPIALITGASRGIGRSFAENLAKRKFDVLLVARSEAQLQELCDDLSTRFQVTADFFVADLVDPASPKKIIHWIERSGYEVSVLINNAGFGLWGRFDELPLEEQNEMISVNVNAVVNLTYLMLPKLGRQKKAYILNVASTTAYQAVPTMAVYAAAKAFILSFSRGLRYELQSTPVSVSCLSPGGAKTDFITRARMPHMQKTSDKLSMTPEDVAEAGIRGMLAGKSEIIPGLMNQVGAFSNRLMPKALVEKVAAGIYIKKGK
jgi:short-subunit dehydrogenase